MCVCVCVILSILLDLLYCVRSSALAKVCEAVSQARQGSRLSGLLHGAYMDCKWCCVRMHHKYAAVLLGSGVHACPSLHCCHL